MLVSDLRIIGAQLFEMRKAAGKTQAEVAEAAEISDRAYADIERGTANMRLETLIRICRALHITPDEILTSDEWDASTRGYEMVSKLQKYPQHVQKTAYDLIDVYLNSIG